MVVPLRTSAGATTAAVVERASVHSDDEPCIADELLDRLIPAMLRTGVLASDTLLEMADQMDREAQECSIEREAVLGRMATALRAWVIEADGPTQSEWLAERSRKRFTVIEMKPEG